MSKAVFLDRDGVVNEVLLDESGRQRSPRKIEEFRFKEGIHDVTQILLARGYLVILITNQPEVKRGLLPVTELEKMNELIRRELELHDFKICLHDNADRCTCRKPEPGMILEAAAEHDIDLGSSVIVGDTDRDVEVGRRAGCKTILLDAQYNRAVEPDVRISSLREILLHCP